MSINIPSGYKQTKVGVIPEDWKAIELAKLLTFKNGINASKEQYGTGYKFINVLDIINNLVINYNNIIGLVNITEKELKLYEVKYGDILFQRSSETREEVGQSNIYLDKNKIAVFGGFVIKGTPKQEYNPLYMNYLLKIRIVRNQIISRSGGSTRYNIGQNSLNQVIIPFPPLKEQQKIAQILTTWDSAISKQEELIEAKERLKKGLMQKLLSGEWEEVKLGDIAKLTSSKRVYLSDYVTKGIPFYRGKEISKLKKNKYIKDLLYISEEKYLEIKDKYGIPKINDILITAVGTLGNILRINNNHKFYFKDGNLIWLKEIKCNSLFLSYLLEYESNNILSSAIGSSQKALTIVALNKIKISIPPLQEQQKIAKVLTTADKEIELLKEELDTLKEQKKGLMQRLLSGVVRVKV